MCYPFKWQVGSRHARIAALSVLALSILASVPLAVVNGRQTKPIPASFTSDLNSKQRVDQNHRTHDQTLVNGTFTIGDGAFANYLNDATNSTEPMMSTKQNETITLYGHECTTDDAYVGTTMPLIATGILLILFIGSAVPLCTMYGLIGRKAWRHRKQFHVQHIGGSKGGSTTDGVGLRVFRMLSSKRRKPSQPTSSGDTTGSNTNTTSCSGASSSGDKGETSKAEISTISTGEMSRSTGDAPSSSKEDSDSHDLAAQAGNSHTRKLSTPVAETHGNSNSPNTVDKKHSKPAKTKRQNLGSKGQSKDATQPQTQTASESNNFVEINLAPNRSAGGESSSEDLSDTNEGQGKKFVKKSRKSSQSSMFKNLIKRTEGETTFDRKSTKSSWHSKFRRRSSKEKKDRPEVINRTTIMLFTISTIYILGYTSHLAMIFFKISAPSTFNSLGFAGLALWNFFLRLYYVNCAANPVVYSLCDLNFRRNCLTLFKKK